MSDSLARTDIKRMDSQRHLAGVQLQAQYKKRSFTLNTNNVTFAEKTEQNLSPHNAHQINKQYQSKTPKNFKIKSYSVLETKKSFSQT